MAEKPLALQNQAKAFARSNTNNSRKRRKRASRKQNLKADKLLENKLLGLDVDLTSREIEILGYIISGRTNKQIGRAISRTERTVEYHRNHLMRKFDANSTAELVKKALLANIAAF